MPPGPLEVTGAQEGTCFPPSPGYGESSGAGDAKTRRATNILAISRTGKERNYDQAGDRNINPICEYDPSPREKKRSFLQPFHS